jgi:FkbM family methyltransferase
MRWRRALYNLFNYPGLRPLLAAAGTSYASFRNKSLCWVHYDKAWVHEYPAGVIVEPRLLLDTLSDKRQKTKDFFMHQYTPQVGDTVLDVGAGTGWETLFFSQMVGAEGRVISIEANPRVYFCLQKMCRRNKLDNVTLMNCAVAGEERVVNISDKEDYLTNEMLRNVGLPVLGRRLDEIIDTLNLGRVDLLKMNIEGAEGLAIKGMAKMIQRTRHVCICCHDFLAAKRGQEELRTKSSVTAFLQQNGFAISLRETDHRPWVSDCVYGYNRLLAAHKSRDRME